MSERVAATKVAEVARRRSRPARKPTCRTGPQWRRSQRSTVPWRSTWFQVRRTLTRIGKTGLDFFAGGRVKVVSGVPQLDAKITPIKH